MRPNPPVGIRAAVEQNRDQIEGAVGTWWRYGSRQGIAIRDGQIKRSPTLRVRLIRIRSVIEQEPGNFVMTILNGHQ